MPRVTKSTQTPEPLIWIGPLDCVGRSCQRCKCRVRRGVIGCSQDRRRGGWYCLYCRNIIQDEERANAG